MTEPQNGQKIIFSTFFDVIIDSLPHFDHIRPTLKEVLFDPNPNPLALN